MKNHLSGLLALCCLPVFLIAQQGPGGVGRTDGTSTLNYWIDASRGFSTSSGITWADQSGKGVANTVIGTPMLNSGFLNNRNMVEFNPADGADFITTNMSINSAIYPQLDIYLVYYTSGTSTGGVWGEDDGGWDRFMLNDAGPGCASSLSRGSGCVGNPAMFPANTAVITGIHLNEDVSSGSSAFVNGSSVLNFTSNHGPQSSNNFGVASISGTGGYAMTGKIAELIVFGSKRNFAEEIIIYNYLSAKYGIALNDVVIYQQSQLVNGDYDFNVAGIGRFDAGNISSSGRGTGIVTMLNAGGLDDNEFLMWGDDNASALADNTTDIPAGVAARFNRIWRVSETNLSGTAVDIGAVDIQFDLQGHSPINTADLRLLIDSDNDGSFTDETPIAGATLIAGSNYQFAGVTEISDGLRFTIGTANAVQTPLPVQLSFFTAAIEGKNSVTLSWQTASESNSDFFAIQRSADNVGFSTIAEVKGAGNSTTTKNYSVTDMKPLAGTSFYRLMQVDIDGSTTYSSIQKVSFTEEKPSLSIFPNPAGQHIYIKGIADKTGYAIIDQQGRDVTHNTAKSSFELSLGLKVDVSKLGVGVYFVWISGRVLKFYKK